MDRVSERPSLTKEDAPARQEDSFKESDSSESYTKSKGQQYDWYGNESKEQLEISRDAAKILDNPEMLMMHAASRGDSVPATRLHFMKLMCGYITSDPIEKKPAARK